MHHFDDSSQLGRGIPSGRGAAAKAAWLAAEDLTQPIGRAQRHPSRQSAGPRNLPGLMQPGLDSGQAPSPSLSPVRLPMTRPPLDGQLATAYGQVVPINGHHGKLDGHAGPHAPAAVNGTALRGGDGTRAQAAPDYLKIADGMAIAPKVTVVLPVMNEAANLPGVFATLPGWVHEVVLVDGRSTDGTIDVARRLRSDVKVVLQGGVGKGDALAAGFAVASGDIIVAIDGDGSTDGKEIVRFVSALLAGADFAKGSRFSSAGRSDDITTVRRCGNKLLNVTVNRLFGTSFSDLCYGYNAFWSRHLDVLALDSPGFEVETLMSIRAARAGLRIYEVPSHERPRLNGSSNLSAVKDGWRVLRLIAAEKREARRSRARKPKPFMAPGRLQVRQ
jgi:hypothetical protein